jgi:dihydrolipoamide dehydrogenase
LSESSTIKYDLIVIGGGPAGYTASIAAGRLGEKVLLIERDQLGGTCLNVGCIPTKYLLDKAAELEKIRHMTQQGIFRDAGNFSFSKIQTGKDSAVRKLVSGVKSLLKSAGVTVVAGSAKVESAHSVSCNGQEFQTGKILITTGSKPAVPPIPGAAEFTIDSSEALALQSIPDRMAVIGGGVIGLELASAFRSFGSQVIVLEMLDQIMPGEDQDSIQELIRYLTAKKITLKTGARVSRIKKHNDSIVVDFQDKEQTLSIAVDKVLMAAGRKPNLDGINASQLGLKLDEKGFISVDQYMQTSVEDIFAAGDVAGGWQLAHSAYIEAEGAVHNMFGNPKPVDQSVMPRCVYTMPPYAAVGLNASQANRQGIDYSIGKFAYSANGMAIAEDAFEGAAHVICDRATGKILGAQIVGLGAPELIATAAMAVQVGMTVDQWQEIITAHPTLSEILREAALDCKGMSIHTPQKI